VKSSESPPAILGLVFDFHKRVNHLHVREP
jgi:hypothetical protein